MKQILTVLSFSALLFACKNTGEKKETNATPPETSTVTKLECTGEEIPAVQGDQIFSRKDSAAGLEYITTISFEKDSLVIYNYIPGIGTGTLTENDIIHVAYTDIDPAGLETTEYDIDLTDGGKQHTTAFFIRAKNENKVFRNHIYTCTDKDVHYKEYMIHTINTACSSIDVAKQMVEKIKGKPGTGK